jgi:hypothetical protein
VADFKKGDASPSIIAALEEYALEIIRKLIIEIQKGCCERKRKSSENK